MKKIVKKLQFNYYIVYALLVLSAAAGWFLARRVALSDLAVQQLSSAGILLMLASVPYSFYFYKKQTARLRQLPPDARLLRISAVVNARTLVIAVPLLFNVLASYLTPGNSLIFCAAMSALILVYTKPTAAKLERDLELEED